MNFFLLMYLLHEVVLQMLCSGWCGYFDRCSEKLFSGVFEHIVVELRIF